MTDFVTLLECENGRRLCKRYTDLGLPPEDYDAGMFFTPTTIQIANLDDLACLLLELVDRPRCCIVRGACHPEAEGQRVRRLAIDRPGECDAAFGPSAHYWLALDVDHCDVPFLIEDPEACVRRWRQTLPVGMESELLVWQWSAKAHLSPTVRGRAWVWFDEPVTDEEARAFCKAYGWDPALCSPVQPHYCARPIFEGCGPDPILDPLLWVD